MKLGKKCHFGTKSSQNALKINFKNRPNSYQILTWKKNYCECNVMTSLKSTLFKELGSYIVAIRGENLKNTSYFSFFQVFFNCKGFFFFKCIFFVIRSKFLFFLRFNTIIETVPFPFLKRGFYQNLGNRPLQIALLLGDFFSNVEPEIGEIG